MMVLLVIKVNVDPLVVQVKLAKKDLEVALVPVDLSEHKVLLEKREMLVKKALLELPVIGDLLVSVVLQASKDRRDHRVSQERMVCRATLDKEENQVSKVKLALKDPPV